MYKKRIKIIAADLSNNKKRKEFYVQHQKLIRESTKIKKRLETHYLYSNVIISSELSHSSYKYLQSPRNVRHVTPVISL